MTLPEWVYALAHSLLHTIWQFALVGLFCWILLKLIPIRLANLRYNVASSLLALMPVIFFLNFMQLSSVEFEFSAKATSFNHVSVIAAIVTFVWVTGVVVGLMKLALSLQRVRTLANEPNLPIPEFMETSLRHLVQQMNIGRHVKVRLSHLVSGPCTFSLWRPVILVPVGCIARLSTEEMEAVIAHELAHIKRFDSLHRVLQSICEALFFYHPAVAYVSRQISLEREHACDDLALAAIEQPKPLATGLLKAGIVSADNTLILGANTPEIASLEERIGRLVSLSAQEPTRNRLPAKVAFSSFLLSIAAAVSFATAFTWADQASASLLDRPKLIGLKDAACDEIKRARLYSDPKFYQGGPATLYLSDSVVRMNEVVLPAQTQSALKRVFDEYELSEYEEVQLRYFGADIELAVKPKAEDSNHTYFVFITTPYSQVVEATRRSSRS